MPILGSTGYRGRSTCSPWRVSSLGIRANTAYRPNRADADGDQGQGATTRALTTPLATSFLRRVSTKIPSWGCNRFGYNVVKVRIRTRQRPNRSDEAGLA